MTTALPLDELYLNWLYGQVAAVEHNSPSRTYWSLFRKLYTTEFVWLIPNDDNRVEDGRDLRHEFLEQERVGFVDRNWMELGCSFLEMLVALSRRFAFEAEGEPADCFWHMMRTLGFDIYTDNKQMPHRRIEDRLNSIIFRTYHKSGRGGLFPLKHPQHDQRNVEIWYQLNAYLLELDDDY